VTTTHDAPHDAGRRAPGASRSDSPSAYLSQVTKTYGATTAVDALDLVVDHGEFLSLLGPSGCGKTTTLRLLAGFEQPDAGVVSIAGRDVSGVPPHKRDVNTVFQHYALFPHLTVAENVAFGLRMSRTPRRDVGRRVGEALEMVKMSHLAGRKPKQMSGGQQQRVALARALVNRPSLLLLDEPLGALDRKLRQEMQIELKLLQSQVGITFVYVTHDQEEALSMSDRIAVMLDGRIQQLADPDTMYDQPATAFVAGFLGQQNFLTGTASHGGHVVSGTGWRARSERVAAEAQLNDGARALVAVRPEAVTISPASTDADRGRAENGVVGTLAGVSHLGDAVQYVVRSQAEAGWSGEMLCRRPRHGAPRLSVGDAVWCSWGSDQIHVFPDTQADLVLGVPGVRDENS